DVGVRVGPVDSPGRQDPLHQTVVTRPADVVHDLFVPSLLEGAADPSADVGERLRPRDARPLPLPATADTLQWIKDAVRIVDLIDRGRTLGAVAPAASGMKRI